MGIDHFGDVNKMIGSKEIQGFDHFPDVRKMVGKRRIKL